MHNSYVHDKDNCDILLGGFKCVVDTVLDSSKPQRTNDTGTTELKSLMEIYDVWRDHNPDTKRFTFQCYNSKLIAFFVPLF